MNKKPIDQLYAEHIGKVSDKWSLYLDVYDQVFTKFRDRPIKLLEIGVQNGGSLEIWAKYFRRASIFVGCDINKACEAITFADSRIKLVIGNANSHIHHDQVLGLSKEYDIVIDDGSHLSRDIIKSFALYFPSIVDGGIFVAEDLHCSYWREFEGGIFDPFSSISFFKRLVDIINHEHWGLIKERVDILRGILSRYECDIDVESLKKIHSVEFINSMCIIRKAPSSSNSLGKRVIAGIIEQVVPGHLTLNGNVYEFDKGLEQSRNEFSIMAIPPDENFKFICQELRSQNNEIEKRDKLILSLSNEIKVCNNENEKKDQIIWTLSEEIKVCNNENEKKDQIIWTLSEEIKVRNSELQSIFMSTSWRLTKPLRFIKKKLKIINKFKINIL
jgi:hypothetical protein